MTCTRSKTYFKNQKGGLEEGLAKQNVHLMHCIFESEAHNWSAGVPSAHAVWSRLFSVHLISKYCMQRLRTVRACKFRGELAVYFSIASKDIQSAVTTV